MKIKKLTAILLSTLMVLGLTACGSQDTQSGQSVQNSVSTVQDAGGSAAAENPADSGQTGGAAAENPKASAEPSAEETTEALTGSSTEEAAELQADSETGEDTGTLTDPSTGDASEAAPEANADGGTAGKTLVVYYSATGTTENVANYIAAATGADLFELEPVNAYSSDDLNWTDDNSRVVYEHDNPEARVVELAAATVDDWASYDTVFIGYPIWWHIAAWPVDGFVTANDFTGKTVIPFCTSSSSGIGESGELLAEAAGTGNWLEGERFSSGASAETVQTWVDSLGLD